MEMGKETGSAEWTNALTTGMWPYSHASYMTMEASSDNTGSLGWEMEMSTELDTTEQEKSLPFLCDT